MAAPARSPPPATRSSNYWVDVVFASNTLQFEQVASSSGSVAAGNTFLSMVLDNSPNGQTAIWDKLFVSKADLPTGVSLDVQVRTGNTPNLNDGTWSLWTAVNHGDAVPNANARYLQYQVSLSIPPGQTVQMPVDFEIDVTSVANTKAHESTNNDQVTSLPTVSAPVLAGIAAPVTAGDSGVPPTEPLVSDNVYDAGQGNVWQSLSWTAPVYRRMRRWSLRSAPAIHRRPIGVGRHGQRSATAGISWCPESICNTAYGC